jgi:flagellar biosynthesis/type III secretory pathway chaperone
MCQVQRQKKCEEKTNKQDQDKNKTLEKKWEYTKLINKTHRQVEVNIRNYGIMGALISQGVYFELADQVHETWYKYYDSRGLFKVLLFNFLY